MPSFNKLFDQHAIAMLLIDPENGTIVNANPAASRFYGYSHAQLKAMSIQDINTLTPEQVAAERRRAKIEARNYFIFHHRRADDSIRTVEVYSRPFDFNGRELLHSIVIDISERRDLQDALWHQQKELKKTVASQTQHIRLQSQKKLIIVGASSLILFVMVILLWRARSLAVAGQKKLDVQRRRLADVIEGTYVGTWEWNVQNGDMQFNDRWSEIIGYEPEEIAAQSRYSWMAFIYPDDLILSNQLIKKHFNGELGRYECEMRMRHKNGHWIWVLDRGKVSSWTEDGQPLLMSGTHQEITERKLNEEKLRKLSRAVEASSSGVIMTNPVGVIEYVNPKFTKMTGYSKEEAIGEHLSFLKSGDTSDRVYNDLWKTISIGGQWKGKLHNQKKDGSFYWARDSISGVTDEKGKLTHYIDIQDDITHEFELAKRLSYQASHDTLTGLLNRRKFERRADKLLSSAMLSKEEHALCFMDLDQFKVINDTCGHIAGDELLRQLSRELLKVVRQHDTLARLGGDEFGVLLEHCSLDKAHQIASKLQQVVQAYQFTWQGQSFRVGISIGLVAITDAIPNLTELLKQADAACYMAKDLGRNRIHVYYPEDTELVQRHGEMQWVARINAALEDNRFHLYAQPIVPLGGSNEKHYELLLRMLSEDDKIVPPGAFLPAAERYNLIEKLDAWVIKNAFRLLAANPGFVEQIHFISINLSGQSLTNDDFLTSIVRQLKDSHIEARKICFEVTETVAISNLTEAICFISTLRDIGCRFALDDFGSGLSSFGYLKNLPVDYLKIDGMFVKDIVEDPIDHAMVKSINDIGQVMGMKTIAEFVENNKIMEMLKQIGVDYGQGYGIGKPQPFSELLASFNEK